MAESRVRKELTQAKFAEFLYWLNADAEKAGEEYERLRFRLITFFSQRNSRFPEELADETINRIALKMGEIAVENKSAFCHGVAKNVLLESLRRAKEFLNIEDMQIAAPEMREPDFSNACLDKCLNELPPENRTLILDYFAENKVVKIEERKQLSAGLEMSQTALRMKVMRIKKRLKVCVSECIA